MERIHFSQQLGRYLRMADACWKAACLLWICSISGTGSAFVVSMEDGGSTPSGPPAPKYYMGESANVSRLIDSLLIGYDKRLRPNYKVVGKENPATKYTGPPVEVGITMYVSSVSSISEVDMDFTLDFYFRQHWRDTRLSFDENEDELCISNEMLSKIWWPDTFFTNAKDAKFHFATTKNAFLRIKPSGEITQSLRLTVTAMCNMDLTLFPMDSQKCSLEIESYGYSEKDIKYTWMRKGGKDPVGIDNEVQLPQFSVRGYSTAERTITLSTGNYSRLGCQFYFSRSLGYYVLQIYVPCGLIVTLSWVSFWLSREAVPARVALGITTVLTMTTLISSTNASLPKISYLKSIDVYLIVCFFMVFASLMEYAAVSYMSNRCKNRPPPVKRRNSDPHSRTCEKLANHGCSNTSPPVNTEVRLSSMRKLHSECDFKQLSSGNYVAVTPCRPRLSLDDTDGEIDAGGLRYTCAPVPCCAKPSIIDKYSRVFFPLSFLGFNLLYWVTYMNVSNLEEESNIVIVN